MENFPKFSPLAIQDRAIVKPILEKEQPVISEMTFANMYVWHRSEKVEVSVFQKSLIFRGIRENREVLYSPPVGEDDKVKIVKNMVENSLKEGVPFLMKGIVEPLTSQLIREGFKPVPDRDNWDYVYSRAELANLSGSKFHSKRKDINKFQSKYKHEYRRITPSLVPECIKLQEEWCLLRNCNESPSLQEENYAILEALQNFDELGLTGSAVFVEGKVMAFTIGEMLNSSTWVTHFEKASPDFPGLYQYINQKFAAELLPTYEFINREQDLGEEGLRVAKMSYHPHHMVEKSKLRIDK